jgi:hypothetical protein
LFIGTGQITRTTLSTIEINSIERPFGWCLVFIPSDIASFSLILPSGGGDGKLCTAAVKKAATIKRVCWQSMATPKMCNGANRWNLKSAMVKRSAITDPSMT